MPIPRNKVGYIQEIEVLLNESKPQETFINVSISDDVQGLAGRELWTFIARNITSSYADDVSGEKSAIPYSIIATITLALIRDALLNSKKIQFEGNHHIRGIDRLNTEYLDKTIIGKVKIFK